MLTSFTSLIQVSAVEFYFEMSQTFHSEDPEVRLFYRIIHTSAVNFNRQYLQWLNLHCPLQAKTQVPVFCSSQNLSGKNEENLNNFEITHPLLQNPKNLIFTDGLTGITINKSRYSFQQLICEEIAEDNLGYFFQCLFTHL